MDSERKRIIERVQKLFALAEQKDSPEEAQVAAMRAQELLQKYDLSLSEVEVRESGSNLCGEQRITLGKRNAPTWIKFLQSSVAENFDVESLRGVCLHDTVLFFIGVEPDVTIARHTFEYLHNFIVTYDLNGKTVTQKNEWRMGFIYAVRERLEEQKRARANNPTITSLVLAKEQIAKDYIENRYKVTSARRLPRTEASRSFREGVAVGMTTPINRPVEGRGE